MTLPPAAADLSLPLATPDLPGTGGVLKAEPADFVVEELPLYAPAGEGDHAYFRLTRTGWNTRDLEVAIARSLGVRADEVGTAGLKDKHAVVTQTFSVYLLGRDIDEAAAKLAADLPVTVEAAVWHRNKLRRGHLAGNRFHVTLRGVVPEAAERAQAVLTQVVQSGMPNFYGPQRFGMRGDNAASGRDLLAGRSRAPRWERRFLLGALQAQLFNAWLALRIERGYFDVVLAGDLAKKTDTGGLFEVSDEAAEQLRFQDGAIVFTGPIYGAGMRWPTGIPGDLEREILEREGLDDAAFKKARLEGTRRPGIVRPAEVELGGSDTPGQPVAGAAEPAAPGGATSPSVDAMSLKLSFTLPKGAYATTLLREIMKAEPDSSVDAGADE
jgi:tRNA pseudouridine13 synthase